MIVAAFNGLDLLGFVAVYALVGWLILNGARNLDRRDDEADRRFHEETREPDVKPTLYDQANEDAA